MEIGGDQRCGGNGEEEGGFGENSVDVLESC